jgi:hypothetical protein
MGGNSGESREFGKRFYVGSGFWQHMLPLCIPYFSPNADFWVAVGESQTTVHICFLSYSLCSAACLLEVNSSQADLLALVHGAYFFMKNPQTAPV